MAEPRQSPFELIDSVYKEPDNIVAPTAEHYSTQRVRRYFAELILYDDAFQGWSARIKARLWLWTLTDEQVSHIILDCTGKCLEIEEEETPPTMWQKFSGFIF